MKRNSGKTKSKLINEILDNITINATELRTVLGVSRGKFAELKNEGHLPEAIELGPRSTRWSTKVVREWIDGGKA